MTHSLVGFGLIVDLHARVSAFARAHFSSASAEAKVPSAIVFPAHCYEHRNGDGKNKK